MQSLEELGVVLSCSGTTCPHGRVRYLDTCLDCFRGLQACVQEWKEESERLKHERRIGKCKHGRLRRRCKLCKGSQICRHGQNRVYCAVCDGRRLCVVCRNHIVKVCRGTCRTCQNGGRRMRKGERAALLALRREARGLESVGAR
jgi:hypothetical protein